MNALFGSLEPRVARVFYSFAEPEELDKRVVCGLPSDPLTQELRRTKGVFAYLIHNPMLSDTRKEVHDHQTDRQTLTGGWNTSDAPPNPEAQKVTAVTAVVMKHFFLLLHPRNISSLRE